MKFRGIIHSKKVWSPKPVVMLDDTTGPIPFGSVKEAIAWRNQAARSRPRVMTWEIYKFVDEWIPISRADWQT